jgi:hypothetical protein
MGIACGQVSDHTVRPQPRSTTRRAGVRAPSPFACAHRRGGPARRTPARAPGCVADCSGRCPSVGTSCTMTTTDAEEVHRLRQRLEKSEATRAKLRASLIALKVCVSEVSPPPPPPPPRARARSPRPDVPASIARAIAHLPVRPVPTHTEPSNLRTRNRTVPRTHPGSSLLAVPGERQRARASAGGCGETRRARPRKRRHRNLRARKKRNLRAERGERRRASRGALGGARGRRAV